jgi:hypothetical protein
MHRRSKGRRQRADGPPYTDLDYRGVRVSVPDPSNFAIQHVACGKSVLIEHADAVRRGLLARTRLPDDGTGRLAGQLDGGGAVIGGSVEIGALNRVRAGLDGLRLGRRNESGAQKHRSKNCSLHESLPLSRSLSTTRRYQNLCWRILGARNKKGRATMPGPVVLDVATFRRRSPDSSGFRG